jgi:hypothetical protein
LWRKRWVGICSFEAHRSTPHASVITTARLPGRTRADDQTIRLFGCQDKFGLMPGFTSGDGGLP